MKLNIKVTDDKLEKNGAWVEWPMLEGVSVKLTRSTLPNTQKHLQRLLKQNRKALRNTDLQREVYIKFLANYVLLDWKGIIDEDTGKEFPHSVENAIAVMTENNDFYNWVENESANLLNFTPMDDEDEDTSLEERGEELKK